jgi:prepilin-type N-terminal cleavage/methylation domain-containing protein
MFRMYDVDPAAGPEMTLNLNRRTTSIEGELPVIARIRKSMEEKDQGFTLIELLVVMIIIGILAAIAIPVFLNQRKKAVDTAAKADVSTLGKEVATYYVDSTTDLVTGDITGPANGRYAIKTADIGKVSKGVAYKSYKHGADPATTWCVDVTVTGGTATAMSYSAIGGLAATACP